MDKQGWVFLGLLAWITSFLWAMTGSQLALWIVIGLTLLAAPFIPTEHTTDGFDHYEDTDHYQDRSGDDSGTPDEDAAPARPRGGVDTSPTPTRTVVCSSCDQPVSAENEACERCSSVGTWRK